MLKKALGNFNYHLVGTPKDIHKFSHLSNSKKSSQKHEDVGKDKPVGTCYHCVGKHSQSTCHFKSDQCRFCNKRRHTAKVCKSRIAQSSQNKASVVGDSSKVTHQVRQDSCDTDSFEFTLPSQQTKPLQADVEIEGHHLSMEINTGATVSIISDKTCTSLPHLKKLPLQPTQVTL